ncbi:hypothetical protein RvY_03357 [Ramazzottius varieornatus]|uniref:Ca2+-activated K+ channel Slowpoke-like C-terminal domain-containing protein n=1 Tax=Ramazzottius varieornatus TaxID=947166 RepID=A0A1D1UTI8_RAMVA|nr:hypothetical protein RvY_03357 [Ramazzottius varieornatus]
MAEGPGLVLPSATTSAVQPKNLLYTQALRLIDISKRSLRHFASSSYGQMFLTLLQEYGILALGLYRLFAEAQTDGATSVQDDFATSAGPSRLRFVACNPPADTVVLMTDQVYLLFPLSST